MLTLIFSLPMGQCFLANGIEQWGKRLAKPVILNDLTTHLDNEYLD
ncbi:hypothetical protein H1P_1040021 [Hyella patelloides LEGE 07179]|uniref:Uncharacterized protein n=1 Tax=Hyella patelloides LEGE 07179 TaxID=945734 RepID=A0A563VJF8_9CYAN|nr:hypothetical protein H1P_1040021 [Hyella patelloides LEGE 07179]